MDRNSRVSHYSLSVNSAADLRVSELPDLSSYLDFVSEPRIPYPRIFIFAYHLPFRKPSQPVELVT